MPSKQRFNVVVLPKIYQWIVDKATEQGRPPSNLAAFLLTRAVEQEIERELKNGNTSTVNSSTPPST
ncbi:hypothetical protein NIES4071_65310 [Calothrix sp. NIES-4071]|nr:hypothetical protein NIES4071_65310 [Calothrix sp. NIES-4071]BAZ60835.1 hypothetical protein NIES4105_65270 [Calothrix sp. NIES-4105]